MGQKLIRIYFGILSAVMPKRAAKTGFQIFQKVRKKDIRPREKDFFERANKFNVSAQIDDNRTEEIDCYELGDSSAELIFLVHGWDSNAGSMSQIAYKLEKMGKRIILFNLPGHAFSVSDHTNLLECRIAMNAVLDYVKPKDGFSVISHSFGSAVVSYALSKNTYQVNKLVFLTNPNKVEHIFDDFKRIIGLGDRAYEAMLKLTEEKLGEPIEAISVENNLKKITFNELLLIHDKNDRVLTYQNAIEVNRSIPKKSNLLTYENIGHYKMLWNDQVIQNCIDFIETS